MLKRSLEEWLAEIEARHPSEIDLGLERVSLVWELLKQEIPPSRSVTPVNICLLYTSDAADE